MLKKIIKYFKLKRFNKQCPKIICKECKYYYYDYDKRCCYLLEKLGL